MQEQYDPADVQDLIIDPQRDEVVKNLVQFQTGGLAGYDNYGDIVEEGLWEAFNAGVNLTKVPTIVIENLSELMDAITTKVLEVHNGH